MRTLHSWSKKIQALGIHVFKAYTEFQKYPCIISEDMSILLSAIFIFCGLILLLVTEISEQPRYIFANISGPGEYHIKPDCCIETLGSRPDVKKGGATLAVWQKIVNENHAYFR